MKPKKKTPKTTEPSSASGAKSSSTPKGKKPSFKGEGKPKEITFHALDLTECMRYMGKKLNIDLRDVNGTFRDPAQPYHDFWRFVLDQHNPHREGFIHFHQEVCDEIEQPWAKKIYQEFLNEFATNNEITFFVDW